MSEHVVHVDEAIRTDGRPATSSVVAGSEVFAKWQRPSTGLERAFDLEYARKPG